MTIDSLTKIIKLPTMELAYHSCLTRNAGADSCHVNIPNIVAIFGNPGSGKTSFARALANLSNTFLHFPADPLFSSHIAPFLPNWRQFLVYPDQSNQHFSVLKYVNSISFDCNLFLECLKEELRRKLQHSPQTQIVLLDGYVFKDYAKIFKELNLLPHRTLALHASLVNNRHIVEEFDVTGQVYDPVLKHIQDYFFKKCVETTIPKSRYQSFKSFKLTELASDGNTDSNTAEKYKASHLDNVIKASDKFLDIGSNAGYFCFQVANKSTRSIVGIDITRSWLEIASHINNSIFLRDNITFFNIEALEFLSANPASFDIIHCSSTYHYFRERQISFLREAYRALASNGLLVLEVELANINTGPEIVKRARGVDVTPCLFPNRAMFLQQIAGLFRVEAEFESVFQKGSFYSRSYFHLRPIKPAVKFVVDKAEENRVSGWAMYPGSPHEIVKLLIKINQEKNFTVFANLHRPDLFSKGIHPTGKCGFNLRLSEEETLCLGDTVSISIVVENLGAAIETRLLTNRRVE